jgi:Paired amphipathic helix repeat
MQIRHVTYHLRIVLYQLIMVICSIASFNEYDKFCLTECRISVDEVIGEVDALFKGHEELLAQFKSILSSYYEGKTDINPFDILEPLGFLYKIKVHILKSENACDCCICSS